MHNEIAFEGTFKPKNHLNNNNYPGNVGGADESGMPYGTFGGPQLRVPDDRKSYQIDASEGNVPGQSFHVKGANNNHN